MKSWLLSLVLFGLLVPTLAAADLDGWRIVQVSTVDRLAVAKSPDGMLRLVRVGDRLGERIAVTGFDDGRVVLEAPGEWGRATLYVSVADGRQRIDRRERQPLRKAEVAGGKAEVTVLSAE